MTVRRPVASSGPDASFALLYEQSSPHLLAIILGIVPEREAAERILEALFVRAWSRRAEYDPGDRRGLCTLVALARQAALDSVRSGAARRSEALPTLPSEVLRARPEGPRQALALAYFEGLGNAEIADRLGQEVGTVRTWLRAAIESVRTA